MAMHSMPDENWLRNVFASVDKDRSGAICATELQSALSNGTWKPFNPETIRLFIGMFDKDGSGTVDFNEFTQLWRYVTDWLNCFRSFDRDASGNIDMAELKQAMTTFGYRLSDKFYQLVTRKFDRDGQGKIYFDSFVQLCVQLQTMTSAFRSHDTDQDGVITIGYEDFLTLVFSVCMQLNTNPPTSAS